MQTNSFHPTTEAKLEMEAWFKHFDQASKNFEFEKMADEGRFPMYVITDSSTGDGVTKVWQRADYLAAMKNAMANTPKDIKYETKRDVKMISSNIALVLTEWNTTGNVDTIKLKYVDILIKAEGKWKFQTMIQGGWGDFL